MPMPIMGRNMPGMMPQQTDAPMGVGQPTPPGGVMTPTSVMQGGAFQAQLQIRQLEQQLMDAQRKYSQMQAMTNNPQQLAAMQSGMSGIAQKIAMLKQDAQRSLSMQALQAQQRAQSPGAGSMGVGPGTGGRPLQSGIDNSRMIQMLAGMFGGGGMGSEREW